MAKDRHFPLVEINESFLLMEIILEEAVGQAFSLKLHPLPCPLHQVGVIPIWGKHGESSGSWYPEAVGKDPCVSQDRRHLSVGNRYSTPLLQTDLKWKKPLCIYPSDWGPWSEEWAGSICSCPWLPVSRR